MTATDITQSGNKKNKAPPEVLNGKAALQQDEASAEKKRRAPPVYYSPELAIEICKRLSRGETVSSICSEPGMPVKSAFLDWVDDDRDGLRERYARAREALMDHWAEEIVTIADDSTSEPNDRRVRVDTRKWLMSKIAYRKYGDKLVHSGDPDNPIQHMHKVARVEALRPEELDALDAFTQARLTVIDAEAVEVEPNS